MLEVITVPAFSDNYIWLIRNPGQPYVAIVDPGDADPVLRVLQKESLIPTAILITHHHEDHIGGVRRLLSEYEHLPVYGPLRESIPDVTHPLNGGEQIVLDKIDAKFTVLDVPGHTAGHLAYYGHGLLFCGDTLFTAGCGRLFEGTAEQMTDSLEKIAALPDDTLIYCAHEYTLDNLVFAKTAEPDNHDLDIRIEESHRLRDRDIPTVPSTLLLEKKTNPFLRYHLPNVTSAIEQFAGKRLNSNSERFAAIRYWKDTLD